MNFEEQVAVAWTNVARPGRVEIAPCTYASPCDDCQDLTVYFAEKTWQELTNVYELRIRSEEAVTLFTDSAFHYFLPAFMFATLADPEEADIIPRTIIHAVENELGASPRGRFACFTPSQLKTVGAFLRLLPDVAWEEREEMDALAERMLQPT